MSSDQGSKERGRGGALLVVALLLALGAVALLAPDGDGTDAGKVAVVTTASGTPVGAPKVDLLPDGTASGGQVAIRPLGDEALADVPEGTFFKRAGPEGAVVDARHAASTDEATVRATGLRGRVLTTAGAPVAGARVSLRGNRPDAAGMTIMKFEPNAAGEMELSSPGELRPPEATTDADGAFAFMGLDPSFRFTIHAQPATPDSDLLPAKRPAPALRAGQTVDAGDVRLTRAARLSGTVYGDDGRPLPEATVRLGGEDGMVMFGGGEEGGSEGPVGGIAITKSFRMAAPAGGVDAWEDARRGAAAAARARPGGPPTRR